MDYKTIAKKGEYEFTVNRSRFIGTALPVSDEDAALGFIREIKSNYGDARHNVYAYALGANRRRYTDDGEPQGTAGLPVLSVIEHLGITDCAVVVTRYFGGILLGTGGLVRAYTKAAEGAFQDGGVVSMVKCKLCRIKCDYSLYAALQSVIEQNGGTVENCDFTDSVVISFYVAEGIYETVAKEITECSLGRVSVAVCGEDYKGIAVQD